jgi:hypothetical protein
MTPYVSTWKITLVPENIWASTRRSRVGCPIRPKQFLFWKLICRAWALFDSETRLDFRVTRGKCAIAEEGQLPDRGGTFRAHTWLDDRKSEPTKSPRWIFKLSNFKISHQSGLTAIFEHDPLILKPEISLPSP